MPVGVAAAVGVLGDGRTSSASSVGVRARVAASVGSTAAHQPKGSPPVPPHRSPNPPLPIHQDISPPLRIIPPAPPAPGGEREHEEHAIPRPGASAAPDPVVQSSAAAAAAPALLTSFAGLGNGFTGPGGTMTVDSAPPDDNGAVGPSHYVQVVNESFAVFSKTGTVLYGPARTRTIWSGFGGGCQTYNDGDATVEYDRLADRWVISQFSVSTTPYLMCVAVSTSGDPTGSYYRYSYEYSSFPDYPKLGVWPDAYYVTLNLFSGNTFVGPEVCAYDRAKLLTGQTATQQCFVLSSSYGSMLPSDLDGPTPPPAGAPNYLLEVGTGVLHLWKLHVDWTDPASSTLSTPASIAVASFSPACGSSTVCIPQYGTTQKLDSLSDRLMYRLAYRNFGDHESLVTTHAVVAGPSVGVRWYELRDPGGAPIVYQQGTYAPDSTYRWMASAAMDGNGDIALGYSASSSTIRPGIRYTGRLAGDPLGQMTLGEGILSSGGGSQTGGLDRWGDYTSMSIDPGDDCTFWYTNEYLPSSGSFNWRTRIGSFRLPGCGSEVTSDFSLSATPTSLSVAQGGSGQVAISTAVTSGSAESIALSASGQPTGGVTFSPSSVTAGGSSTMTVDVDPSAATGTYTITVTGTSASATHSVGVTLTVTASAPANAVANGGFETGALSSWTTAGAYLPRVVATPHSGSFAARVGSTSPISGNSTLKQTVKVPSGSPRLTFWYQPHCADSIADDQIKVQVRNTSGTVLATVLKACTNTGVWTQTSYSMSSYAGKTVVLWFLDHDDGQRGDPSYFLLDDVSLG